MAKDDKTLEKLLMEQPMQLVLQPTQQLSVGVSLAKRGLQNILDDAVSKATDQCMQLFIEKLFTEALAVCETAMKISPTDEGLLQLKGVCLARQGNYEDGLKCFDQALSQDPDNQFCWALKAALLSEIGKYAEALACDNRAIEIDPENPSLLEARKRHSSELRTNADPYATFTASLVDDGARNLAEKPKLGRILIVDDTETMRETMQQVLVHHGHRCETVEGGPEALSLLASKNQFDLVIHDLLNPHMDGISLLKEIKQIRPEIPVIVASAVDDNEAALGCIMSGAYHYIRKPLLLEEFLETVGNALAIHDPRRNHTPVPWSEGFQHLILPVVDEKLSVPMVRGGRKHVRDLTAGDIVLCQLTTGTHWLDLFESKGKLKAIDFMPHDKE